MKRFTLFSMFSKCNSSKKRRSVRRGRKVHGGEGSAADYGVKVWGHDQVADPNKGNVIKANLVTGGAVPFSNTPPTMDQTISTANMSKQALDMQGASINYMITPKVAANIQSESVLPKTGGRRKTKRRVSKRKYGHNIRNGRRTKTIY
jgi:hypothetical protein